MKLIVIKKRVSILF